MAKQVKEQKSARLKELEDVFERRARRFSPFEVLGLKSGEVSELDKSTEPKPGSGSSFGEIIRPPDNPPMEGSDPPTPGPTRPTYELTSPSLKFKENSLYKPTTTTKDRHALKSTPSKGNVEASLPRALT